VASFAWNRALQETSAAAVAGMIFIQPLFGLVLGHPVGERVGAAALVGAGIIVSGVLIAALRGERTAASCFARLDARVRRSRRSP